MGEGDAVNGELAALLAASGQTLLLVREGMIVRAFGQAALGYDDAESEGRHIAEYAHPDDVPTILEFVERVRNDQQPPGTVRLRARAADGTWALTEARVVDRRDDPVLAGTVVHLTVVDRDEAEGGAPTIAPPGTAAAAAEPAVPGGDDSADEGYVFPSASGDTGLSTGALASLAEVVPAGILATDLNGFVVYSNAATHGVLGRAGGELSGDGWRSIVHPEDVREVARTSAAAMRGEVRERLFRILGADGDRWILGRFAPLRPAGRITGMVAAFDDVTSQRAVEDALAHRATHDPLTELPNRSLLADRLDQALGRSSREGGPVAVLFVDLDGFKAVNDALGHARGDDVLVRVADRLRDGVRPPDTVARLGGDEFVVVCEGLDAAEARRLAERLQRSLAAPLKEADADGRATASIGASIGVAMVTPPCTAESALQMADAAMYRAKQSGPGGIEVVDPPP